MLLSQIANYFAESRVENVASSSIDFHVNEGSVGREASSRYSYPITEVGADVGRDRFDVREHSVVKKLVKEGRPSKPVIRNRVAPNVVLSRIVVSRLLLSSLSA